MEAGASGAEDHGGDAGLGEEGRVGPAGHSYEAAWASRALDGLFQALGERVLIRYLECGPEQAQIELGFESGVAS